MTLRVERYGDVTRLLMTSAGSRAAGMSVSAYVMRGVMIDSGFHHGRNALLAAVQSLGVRGAIITHWHEDHAGNVGLLAASGVPVLASPETTALLRQRPPIGLYRRVVWGHPPAVVAPLTPFDAGALIAIQTPGHSTDHRVVWDPETGTLFSGDLWLGVRASILHASEDPYQIIESLERIKALSPARMFDAHRGAVANPVAAIEAKADWLNKTLSTVERHVREGWSDERIVKTVLGGEELVGYISAGDYSRRNVVRAVRRRAHRDR